jgi:hypothetical protein
MPLLVVECRCWSPTNNNQSPTNNDQSPTNNDQSLTNNDQSPINNLTKRSASFHFPMIRSLVRSHRTVTGSNKQNSNNKGDEQRGSTHDDFFYDVKKSNSSLPHKVK